MYRRNVMPIQVNSPSNLSSSANVWNETALIRMDPVFPRSSSRSRAHDQHPFGVPRRSKSNDQTNRWKNNPFLNDGLKPGGSDRQSVSGNSFSSGSSERSAKNSPSYSASTAAFAISRNSTGSTIAFPTAGSAQVISPVSAASLGSHDHIPGMIKAYDKIIAYTVRTYVHLSGLIGLDVLSQSEKVKELFITQRDFLMASFKNQTPSTIGSGPLQAAKLKEVRDVARKHVDSPHSPHLEFISETVGALGWVVMGNNPCVFIRESYENGKHHVKTIKKIISRESAESGRRNQIPSVHAEWIKSWQEVVLDLESFVREYHARGLIWNRGRD